MPLEGIRALDLTTWQVGGAATGFLADLGADVIKIEDPVNGDPCRLMGSGGTKLDINPLIEATSRNKRGMTLNLKSPQGRDVFYRMVRASDVVVENYRRGVPERLGVGYETLARHNPAIILASASGMGRRGPDADVGLFDIMGHARSGFMHLVADKERPLRYVGAYGIADQTGGVYFALAIMTALIARSLHGVGQQVETSQLAGLMNLQCLAIQYHLLGKPLEFPNREKNRNVLFNIYRAGDGKWLCLACPQEDRYWHDVCEALELQDIERDPRFAVASVRDNHAPELISLLDRAFAARPRDEWVSLLKARNVNCSPVQDYDDLVQDPQVVENDYLLEVEHPRAGRMRMASVPVALGKTRPRFRRVAPEFGQHTEEVLEEYGYSWAEIEEFREAGVI